MPQAAKCNMDRLIALEISTGTGTNGVRLAHHISFASMVTYHFCFFFETVLVREHSGKVSKNFLGNFSEDSK